MQGISTPSRRLSFTALIGRDQVSRQYVVGGVFLCGCALFCILGGLLSNPPRVDVAQGGGAIFGGLSALCGLGVWQRRRWINDLLRPGIEVEATVVESHDDGNDETWHLAVDYDVAGSRHTFRRSLNLTKRRLAPGDKVQLLIDPDRPGFVWLADDAKIEVAPPA